MLAAFGGTQGLRVITADRKTMLFNSYGFLFIFLPLTVLGYYMIRRLGYRRVSMAWLIAASLVFYGWFNPVYVALVVGSVLFNFVVAISIDKRVKVGQRKALLAAGIAINLLVLGYFKYANFFVDNLNTLFGSDFNLSKIILPLAISFFTIQQIAYLVDCYRGQIPGHDFLKYSFLVAFFPKLISGPIVRYGEMYPPEAEAGPVTSSRDAIVIGLSLFFIGLFKKVILADGVAGYSDMVFVAASRVVPTFFEAWIGALAYSLQLYFDFSGYSDMAIGLALMLGFRLPLNFYSPYKAIDVIDFWRRWHISLSRFLRDYVYIPLGGNRKGPGRRSVNLMVTMLLGGLWHGAGWTFIIWGALHGAYLIMSHAWRGVQRELHWDVRRSSRPAIALSIVVTFIAVTVAWVFFRAEDLGVAFAMLRGMAGFSGVALPDWWLGYLGPLGEGLQRVGITFGAGVPLDPGSIAWVCGLLMICWFAPNSVQFMGRYRTTVDASDGEPVEATDTRLRWSPSLLWASVVAAITVLSILGLTQASRFLYFEF